MLTKAKENETLITHVMFEAQLTEFRGEVAIAVYLRDKTHFVQMKRAMKKNTKYKLKRGNSLFK